jgi:uncharacterized protein YdhG (YjbR/CyaY superfamily)
MFFFVLCKAGIAYARSIVKTVYSELKALIFFWKHYLVPFDNFNALKFERVNVLTR